MKTWRQWYLVGYLIFLLTQCGTNTTTDTPAADVAPTGDTFVLY